MTLIWDGTRGKIIWNRFVNFFAGLTTQNLTVQAKLGQQLIGAQETFLKLNMQRLVILSACHFINYSREDLYIF
jgi:hypothetical protein